MVGIQKIAGSLCQGDIYKDIRIIEDILDYDGKTEYRFIEFPYVVVVSQACDLDQNYKQREMWRLYNENKEENKKPSNMDKFLLSIMVLPMYNYKHFIEGSHLSGLDLEMQKLQMSETKWSNSNYVKNEVPRYHYMEFPREAGIPNSIIDFKHYFTCSYEYLYNARFDDRYVATIDILYRELLSQRFCNYLGRIGLP